MTETTTCILKHTIAIGSVFHVNMAPNAKIVHVGVQVRKEFKSGYEVPCMWTHEAIVEDAKRERRAFCVLGTGVDVNPDWQYVSTFLLYDGSFVGHLFEVMS